jgi:uncharacterized damage-inducible protein DinB
MGPRQLHFRMFAAYNAWATERLYACAAQATPEALREHRGAFFGSLLGTLNHLVVADRLWMSRLEGTSPRGARLDEVLFEDLGELHAARRAEDQRIIGFVAGLGEERLARPLEYVTTAETPQVQPLHEVLAHFFNNQTHHRGQAHHLVGVVLGREKTPVLDLLAFQRSAVKSGSGA